MGCGTSKDKYKGKPHERLLIVPKDHVPVLNEEYVEDEDKCYHAEQLFSVSARDFKIRDITDNPEVDAMDVTSPENDSENTPVYHVDSTIWKNFTGDVGRMMTWDDDKDQEKLIYYLSETAATTAAWRLVKICREENGEVLYTVTEKAMTLDSQYNVYRGDITKGADATKEKRLLKLRANAMENEMLLTDGRTDDPMAIVWTDVVQLTRNFRCKIAAGLDHSFVMAIFIAARLMKAKR